MINSLLNRFSPYHWGMLGIFFISLVLRFWGLERFNTLVFDEVYYAKYANYYLIGKDFFNSHPPLSQYIIAIGIWLGSFLPSTADTTNNLTESLRSTLSYRWINALTGSFIPLVVGAIAYQLNQRLSFSLLATLLTALDGLFLVESRYALNNIYLVLFGLLGHLCFLVAGESKKVNLTWLLISGVCFGSSVAVKWNGLGFLFGLWIIIAIAAIKNYFSNKKQDDFLWQRFTRIKPEFLVLSLILVPLGTYTVLWIPHLLMNPQYNFWEVHREILAFHERIKGNNSQVHPYCSPWYSWLILWRPIAYYYEKVKLGTELRIYDVHAFGNPILWWLSTLAIVIILADLIVKQERFRGGISLYLLCNYVANLLPWIKVTRCTFIYHYMGAYTFALLALAGIFDSYLQSPSQRDRLVVYGFIGLIIIGFLYWLPIFLGLPLSEGEFRWRMWFPSWV